MPDMKLFAGNATPELAQRIADRLYISLGDASVSRFSDGEVAVQINENVRGSDVFIIQSTCAPTNDNLMELVVMIDAMRRASAGVSLQLSLTLVTPVKIVVYVLLVCRLLQKLLLISYLTLVLTAFLLSTYTQSKSKASSMFL